MEYLLSKQNLSTFSDKDLNLLADYYAISYSNRNDLLWLLAISILSSTKYSEMPPNKAWEKYHRELLKRFAGDTSAPSDVDKLPIEMINADPLSSKKYLEWIIKSYLDGGIKLFEDMGRTKTALLEYGYLLKKKLITNKFEQNIHAFCGLAGCQQGKRINQGLDEFLNRFDSELTNIRTVKQKRETEKVYEDDDVTIIIPLTQAASCKYGAGTKWCTAARRDNMFEYYSKQGPLYILIPKKPQYEKEKYQIHIQNSDTMNEMDKYVEYSVIKKRFPTMDVPEFTQLDFIESVLRGNTEEVAKFLENPLVDPSVNNIALKEAANAGLLDIVIILLKDVRVDPAAEDSRALILAAQNGHAETIKLFLQDGRADPAAEDSRALGLAAKNGHTETVKLFLQDGRADPTVGDNYIITVSSDNDYTEIVELLLQDGRADPSAAYNLALQNVVGNGNTRLVRLMLKDKRIDPSVKDPDEDYNQIFTNPSLRGNTEIMKILIDDGRADPSVDDNIALYWATKNGHTDIVELLKGDDRVRAKL